MAVACDHACLVSFPFAISSKRGTSDVAFRQRCHAIVLRRAIGLLEVVLGFDSTELLGWCFGISRDEDGWMKVLPIGKVPS